MKRVTKKVAAVIFAIGITASMSSCIKDVDNSVSPKTGTATIKGRVQAELNTTNADLEPLANQTVYVFVDSKAYAQTPGNATYPKKRFETTTNAEGDYSVDIEVPLKGVAVEVTIPGFIYNVVTPGGLQRTTFNEKTAGAGQAKDGSVLILDINM